MSKDEPDDAKARQVRKEARQVGILTGVPAALVAGPLIGVLAGKFLDHYFKTSPWLLLICLALGFAAAGREVVRMLRLSNQDAPSTKPKAKLGGDDKPRRDR